MQSREAKYCLDQNHIKWSLVEGVITRKDAQDGPQDGQTLPTSQIKAIERTQLTVTHRSALGWPVTLIGLAILGLSLWLISATWLLAAPGIVFGLLLLVWGIKRIPAQAETIAAFRLVAPVQNSEDWIMAGDVPEVVGFLDGVRADMEVENRQKQPA